MSLPVILSENALLTFDAIAEQVLERLGNKAHQDFKKNTLKTLKLISQNPLIYRQTDFDSNVRIALIKKLSSVFYEVKSDRIEILFFWDNRQEPMI